MATTDTSAAGAKAAAKPRRKAAASPPLSPPLSIAHGTPLALRPRLVTDILDKAVSRWPERVALDFMGREWTYEQLGDLVARAAHGLQHEGLGKGDRIVLCLPNTPYYVIAYFAALRIGAVVVNMNPLYSAQEIAHTVEDSGARMIVVPDVAAIHDKVVEAGPPAGITRIVVCPMAAILPTTTGLAYRAMHLRDSVRCPAAPLGVPFRRLTSHGPGFAPVEVVPDDLAVLQYTGGTTGVPKGAMLTHANLAGNSAQMEAHIGNPDSVEHRTLAVLPMFHVFALTAVLNYSIETAAEIVLLPRFEMRNVLKALKRKPITHFFGVPTIYVALANLPEAERPDFSALEACVSGGAPLPEDVRVNFEAACRGHVVEGYGLTEASPIITCNAAHGAVRAGSAGMAFPATTIEIRDPDNPHVIVPQGDKGEICARGPQVMAGYWQRPEATAEVMIDGALRTGDIGYLDPDGYLFIVDRIKDVILSGGYNVYPRIIEEAAYRFPAVGEAVAIGIPDAYRGQSAKLYVALRPGEGATVEEIAAFLSRELSKIEQPREIEIRASLPRTPIGKLSKKELVAEEAARRAAAGGSA